MKECLTFQEFELALSMLNSEGDRTHGFFLEDHYPKEGRALIDRGILLEGPLNMIIPDRWDDEMDSKEVEWNPETRTYQYWTSHGGGWVDAPEADMKTYELNLNWMFRHISDLVGIDEGMKVRQIVPKLLWELGSIWNGRRKATVFLSRKLSYSRNFDRVYDGLAQWAGKAAGAVLSLTVPDSRHAELPGGHRILSLQDAIVETTGGYEMDMELLHGALKGAYPSSIDVGPLVPSADFSLVTVNGRDFVFTGDKQKQVMEILIRAWKLGQPKCRTQAVLEETESSGHAMSHLFRRHPDWKDLIGYGGGFCWLKV